jgi:UDP-N-acetylglucosamine 2-epimerase (non-hydrolysing)
VADHVGDYLFAPTEHSQEYLRNEGIDDERIFVTGNTIVDAVHQHRDLAAEKSTILEDIEFQATEFGLLTAHRAENVDDSERFENLLEGVRCVAATHNLEIIYPIHPRAQDRLDKFDIAVPDEIRVVDPQDYLDFLQLEANAELILTDSGGVQEEACILGVPCVTLRDNTERPETLEVGANQLAGIKPDTIAASSDQTLRTQNVWTNPFGDGKAAEQILEILGMETEAHV